MSVNILETKELYFSYPDGTPALKGVNFSVRKGEFVGVLGANGSGKTTLLKILNGLLKSSAGAACLEGKGIKTLDKNILFSRVCTCFQNPDDQLFSSTVGEDIAFGPANMGLSKPEVWRRVGEALAAVGMPDSSDRLIHSLSYGQKKRICLAGVLAMGPEVVLLDEPTASLDPMGCSSIMRLLRRINKESGVTMVMSTHCVDLVPLFVDRVVILNQGVIVREGSPREVFSEPRMIRLAQLRLPKIGHLFEILKKRDGLDIDELPLTIGQARAQIKKMRLKI